MEDIEYELIVVVACIEYIECEQVYELICIESEYLYVLICIDCMYIIKVCIWGHHYDNGMYWV